MRRQFSAIICFILFVLLTSITAEANTDIVKEVSINGKNGIMVYHYWDSNPDWYYYFSGLQTSNYATDNIKCFSEDNKIYIQGNLSETPGFFDRQGSDGTMHVISDKWYDVEYKNGIFSACIDITGWDNQYHSISFRANDSCVLAEITVYVYDGKAYFGAGYDCFEKTMYDKYSKTLSILDLLVPDAVLNNYMDSIYAECYEAKKGMKTYEIAHSVTKGCVKNYDKARKIYTWVAENCSCSTASYTMEAMCSSIAIPVVRTRGEYTSDSWVFLYIDNRWIATNPCMATYSNNIGYFDATDANACGYENDDTYACLVDAILQKGAVFEIPQYNCRVEVVSDLADTPQVIYLSYIKNQKKIVVPDTIAVDAIKYKVIGVENGALQNNKKVTNVVVGKHVTSIGKNAFKGCSKLKKITIEGTKIKSVGKNAIKGIHKKATIKVPKKQYKKYKKLFKSRTGYKKTMKIRKR